MKGPLDRTKVVVRHLLPMISRSALVEHVDSRFLGRYRGLSFRQERSSPKLPSYSRAYIDFNKPEDVIEFAEFFNGHVFVNEKGSVSVNEKGTQFKTLVEYAPSQRVPKQWCKKDGCEGTIFEARRESSQCRNTVGEEGSRTSWCFKGYSYSYPFNRLCSAEKSCKDWCSEGVVEWEANKKSYWTYWVRFFKTRLRKVNFYHHDIL